MEQKLLQEVEELPIHQLVDYARTRALWITHNTQSDSWDDVEEWQMDAIELAHAFVRMLRDSIIVQTGEQP